MKNPWIIGDKTPPVRSVPEETKERTNWKKKYDELQDKYSMLNSAQRELEDALMGTELSEFELEMVREIFRGYISKHKINSKMAKTLFKTLTKTNY